MRKTHKMRQRIAVPEDCVWKWVIIWWGPHTITMERILHLWSTGTISMHDARVRGSDLQIWMRQDKNLDIIVNSVENMHDWWVSNSQVDRQCEKTSDGSFSLASSSKQHDLSKKASLTAKLLHCGVPVRADWVQTICVTYHTKWSSAARLPKFVTRYV